jgi:hypothetical protein
VLLEKAIMKELCRKIDVRYDPVNPFDFEREFNVAKDYFLKRDL